MKDSVVQANEEDNVALSCEASGVPKPIIKWYKGTSGLLLSNRMQTPNRMTIKHIQLSDAGSYTCRAENSQGFVEEKITVIVKSMLFFMIAVSTYLQNCSYSTIFNYFFRFHDFCLSFD